jgi:hypothetical protein
MNTRQTIEVLKRRIKSVALMLGASLIVRTRAFGDGPDRAAVRTLKDVRAYFGPVPDAITTRGRPTSTFAIARTRSSRWKSDLTEIPQCELHGGSK